jgi:tetratricopeptide (TPR) repeat protein
MIETEALDRAQLVHVGIAEQGKLVALRGDHREALIHYRAALRMAVEQGAPEAFCRHYTECALESLELMGAHAEVLAYCEQALAHYRERPPSTPLGRHDLAHIQLRRGICLLKSGEREAAREALAAATSVDDRLLPLAATLLRWLQSGLHVDPARVLAEQRRHDYFSVHESRVDRKRAIPLPDALRPPA